MVSPEDAECRGGSGGSLPGLALSFLVSNSSFRWLEHVAHAPDGLDQGWAAGIDLLTQVGDVELDHVRLAAEVVVPYAVKDLCLAEHPPRVAHQVAEQLELRGGQLDELAAAADLTRVLVHTEIADHELVVAGGARDAG